MKGKIDKFVLAILGVILFAYWFPQGGSEASPIPLEEITGVGVSLIFFFYGLKLSSEKLKNGLKNWKLHALIQLSTFLLFPLLVLVFYPLAQWAQMHTFWLSFMFLAALPSTVSSSVVMVSMAKGNLPAAIFNASISGLIGIGITPLWMGLFLKRAAQDFDLGTIYLNLITQILVPVLLGISLQRFLGTFAQRYSGPLSVFDKTIILFIMYKSFAASFHNNLFSSVGLLELFLISVGAIMLFYTVFYLTRFLAMRMGFNEEDCITAQFCGTKKSLVHGTVFSKILLPASLPVGVILLPLMLFHTFQIFVVSIYAAKWAKRSPINSAL